MAAASCLLTKDQLLCSFCLDVLTDPVSTPCGHNFCKNCVIEPIDVDVPFQCPVCMKMFYPKPELQVNTLISEMVDAFRRSEQQPAKREEVPGGISLNKLMVLLLCMVCISFLFGCMKPDRPLEEVSKVEKLVKMEAEIHQGIEEQARAELRRVQSYAVDVTLDPGTANPYLVLSDDGKQVHDSYMEKHLPDNPERFLYSAAVLGKQSFSSGRFYFEVQVKGKTEWTVGVARESIDRRGDITLLSPEDGFWTVGLRNGNEYRAVDDRAVRLCLQSGPEKVGVFVDYEEGLVSFYDVDTAALIYSFTGCSFTDKLYPYFNPGLEDDGRNSAPLIITPID